VSHRHSLPPSVAVRPERRRSSDEVERCAKPSSSSVFISTFSPFSLWPVAYSPRSRFRIALLLLTLLFTSAPSFPHSAFRIPHSAFRIPHSAFSIYFSLLVFFTPAIPIILTGTLIDRGLYVRCAFRLVTKTEANVGKEQYQTYFGFVPCYFKVEHWSSFKCDSSLQHDREPRAPPQKYMVLCRKIV
jgi:hypothetical protein